MINFQGTLAEKPTSTQVKGITSFMKKVYCICRKKFTAALKLSLYNGIMRMCIEDRYLSYNVGCGHPPGICPSFQ